MGELETGHMMDGQPREEYTGHLQPSSSNLHPTVAYSRSLRTPRLPLQSLLSPSRPQNEMSKMGFTSSSSSSPVKALPRSQNTTLPSRLVVITDDGVVFSVLLFSLKRTIS